MVDLDSSVRKVSIVITCYNYEKFVGYALNSAFNQIYPNIEIVLVNDGSTDGSDAVIRPYLNDERIIYIHQRNAGQAVAKNVGIANSTGEFIAFLDADDIWDLDKLQLQMALFEDPQVGVVYSEACFIDQENQSIDYITNSPHLKCERGWIMKKLFMDNFVPFSSAVVRKECFDSLGVMDTSFKMGIDWDLWLRFSVKYKFDYIDQPLLKYRRGHAGQMSKNYEVRKEDTMRIMQQFIDRNGALLSKELVANAMSYSYCNRGYHCRNYQPVKSLKYYLQALKWDWRCKTAYSGLLKLLVVSVFVKVGKFKKQR